MSGAAELLRDAPEISAAEAVDPAELVKELAALPPLEYDRRRQSAADLLGVRMGTLDAEVEKSRPNSREPEQSGGSAVLFAEPQCWRDPVTGAGLLTELSAIFSRFAILPNGAADALALWVLHSWTHDAARISPLLCLSSPEKRCGKTTVLSLLRPLVRRPLPASNITAAALFRATELWRPTLLIDEADTFLRDSEDLRGILNSGHCRDSACVIRTVGDGHEPRAFSTWAPKAIALIGRMPPTLWDRSVVIPMRRKRPDETVERLRLDRLDELAEFPQKCARWAEDFRGALTGTDPATPVGLNDRAADNWRCLLAIGEAAGEGWAERARMACIALTTTDGEDDAAGVMLLEDLEELFTQRGPRLSTEEVLKTLGQMEDRPWPEWKAGRPITARQVSRLLQPFGIKPTTLRIGSRLAKGYERADFEDAFSRYLSRSPSVTPLQPRQEGTACAARSVTGASAVTEANPEGIVPALDCYRVTDQKPLMEGPREVLEL